MTILILFLVISLIFATTAIVVLKNKHLAIVSFVIINLASILSNKQVLLLLMSM